MGDLPRFQPVSEGYRKRKPSWYGLALLGLSFVVLLYLPSYWTLHSSLDIVNRLPVDADRILSRCAALKSSPGIPPNFHSRTHSDRYQLGTKPTLIYNATIWTGMDDGKEEIHGDILLDGGIIKWVKEVDSVEHIQRIYGPSLFILDANGAWVTPGLVDMHSHIGVRSAPLLKGADDTNSHLGITQPWLRALDAMNTHDDAYVYSVSGGVTSALILPGSAGAMGGQAYPIKLRPTSERSPSSKLIEQPGSPNTTGWRQIKHACGENPSNVYKGTRLDTAWAFRAAYNEARLLVERQENYCAAASANQWAGLKEFPEDLKWEALADVIRGKAKVHVHCYESVDFDVIVRLSNEFNFPVAAFHHAHEAYLVPDLIKKAWGPTPAIAIFATNARYKRESYRGSEFAPRILKEKGFRVVLKSDHPVLDSRFLLYEAQQAHFYGLSAELALASVTTTPATVLGLGHRIGFLKGGYDADLVVWDSHPLSLGATPKQVFIDGIPQLETPHIHEKPAALQEVPVTPNFDKEAADAVRYEGLPPLKPSKSIKNVVFTNVKTVWSRVGYGVGIEQTFDAASVNPSQNELTVAVVENGKIRCTGTTSMCQTDSLVGYETVDLENGCLAPGMTSFGAPLGLEEIPSEPTTKDGSVFDPLNGGVPPILGGDGAVIRAADGLQFATREALIAYHSGVTGGISAPVHSGVFAGLGTFFSTGADNKLAKGAVIQEATALHVSVGHSSSGSPSVSTQIAALRRLLLGGGEDEQKKIFSAVVRGKLTLVVRADSANIIATLIALKKEVDQHTGKNMRLTVAGAAEGHLVARELGEANVGIVLIPSHAFPGLWQQRQLLPGPPLTEESALATLIAHNVTVGIGVVEAWSARNTRFDAAWAALEAPSIISKKEALSLVSANLEKLLGAEVNAAEADIVAYHGGDFFGFESKVAGVISSRLGQVDLF